MKCANKPSRCVACQLHAERHQGATYPKPRWANSWSPSRGCIFYLMRYSPYMPNLGSLSHFHGLEEAPVVHRPDPGHLPEVGWPYHFRFNVLQSLHAQFGLFISLPWPRTGTCDTPSWPWSLSWCLLTLSFLIWCPIVRNAFFTLRFTVTQWNFTICCRHQQASFCSKSQDFSWVTV